MKEKLIKSYVDKLTIADIKEFSFNNHIILSNEEYEYIYKLIKDNWYILVFGNSNNLFEEIKANVSSDNYNKIIQLYQKYKSKYSHYL